METRREEQNKKLQFLLLGDIFKKKRKTCLPKWFVEHRARGVDLVNSFLWALSLHVYQSAGCSTRNRNLPLPIAVAWKTEEKMSHFERELSLDLLDWIGVWIPKKM